MPLSTLQSDMATGPGTQGVDLQGSEDVSQGVSAYFAALSAGAGTYGFSSAAHAQALADKVEALTNFFLGRGDISVT